MEARWGQDDRTDEVGWGNMGALWRRGVKQHKEVFANPQCVVGIPVSIHRPWGARGTFTVIAEQGQTRYWQKTFSSLLCRVVLLPSVLRQVHPAEVCPKPADMLKTWRAAYVVNFHT